MDNEGDNHRPTVVQEIAHIHFTTLARLNLINNDIESIEGLTRLQMPHIVSLYLGTHGDNIGTNNITSVGVMRKAVWPGL